MMKSILLIKGKKYYWLFPLILVMLLGAALLLYFTRTGPGIRGDSVRYVMGARNLIVGNGYSRTSGGGEIYPETGFPPFLSIVLAGFGLLGIDMFNGARLLNMLLFAGNILLVGILIFRLTQSSGASVLGSLLFLTASNVVEWHAWLMTEGLFIFLTLLAITSLMSYLETGRLWFLFLSGAVVGISSITRYIGISMVPVGGLVILFAGKGNWKTRFLNALIFIGIGSAPFALWMLRNQGLGDAGLANRQIIFHPMRSEVLRLSLFEVTTWAIPEQVSLPRIIRAFFAILIVGTGPAVFFYGELKHRPLWRPNTLRRFGALSWVLLLYIPAYIGILIINSVLLDAATTYSGVLRYLTPLFSVLVILVVTSYFMIIKDSSWRIVLNRLAASFAIVLIIMNARQSFSLAQESTLALGFTGIRNTWSDVVSELMSLDSTQTITTNNPEMVYYLSDRPGYMLPIIFDPYRQELRDDLPEQINTTTERLKRGGILVIFEKPKKREAEVINLLPVIPKETYAEVTIYIYSP